MFIQSRQGICLLAGMLILILLYKKGNQITKSTNKLRSSIFGASSAELNGFQKEQQQQMQNMTDHVTESMDKFSAAMSEYAKHLESHTAAVQSLAQAARHLEMILSQREINSSKEQSVPGQETNLENSESKTGADVLAKLT